MNRPAAPPARSRARLRRSVRSGPRPAVRPGRAAPLAFALPVAAAVLVGSALAQNGDPAEKRAHPLEKALRYAEVSLEAAEALPAYTATLRRRELVNGEPTEGTIAMKFRQEPFSVYMRFVNPENAGRQILFVENAHGGKMLAKEAGGLKSMMGTVELAPDSALVMSQSRYPITRAGLANMVRGVIRQWTKETQYGETEVKYFADPPPLNGRKVVVIESSHPVPRREFRFAKTRLWMDKETKLPVRLQQYEFRRGGGAPVLAEDYTYTDVSADAPLTAADFDRRGYKL